MAIYRAFGMTIASEVVLYAERTVVEDAEVIIRFGKCPPMTEEPLLELDWVKVSINQAILLVPEVGLFFVHNGKEIIMDIIEGVDEETIRLYLLGTCMGIILQQRKRVAMHGSCVCKKGHALLIMGDSGAGKTSLAAEFLARGWKLMSDDVTPIRNESDFMYVQSSYPGQKMWVDTIERSHSEDRVVDRVIREDDGRQKFQLNAKKVFVNKELPLKYAVMIVPQGDTLCMGEITGFLKTDILMRNVYRRYLVTDKEGQVKQFDTCLKLAKQTKIFLIERPLEKETIKEIADWLIEKMES